MKKSAFKLLVLPFLVFGVAFFLWQKFAPQSSWNTPVATPVVKWQAHKFPVRLLAWTQDGKIISGDDKIVLGWDAKTGKPLGNFKPLKLSYYAALSQDGQLLAVPNNPAGKRKVTWQAHHYKWIEQKAEHDVSMRLSDKKVSTTATETLYSGKGFDIWDIW